MHRLVKTVIDVSIRLCYNTFGGHRRKEVFMKKKLQILVMILVVTFMCIEPALADAMIYYDNDTSVNYNVQVSAPDGGVNFRYGPGVEYGKIISNMIPNGTILQVTRQATASNGGSWGYVNYAGYWGWIALSQVSRINSSSGNSGSSSSGGSTSSGGTSSTLKKTGYYVTVNASDGGVNLRYGPGVSYDRLMNYMIPNGTSLQVHWEDKASNGNTWGFTSYNGMNGWIALSEVSRGGSIPLPMDVHYHVKAAAPDGGINLRDGAGVSYNVILSHMIPNGTSVEIIQETTSTSNGRYWGYTTYEGRSGWVTLEQVTPVAEVMSSSSSTTSGGAVGKASPGSAYASAEGNVVLAAAMPGTLRTDFIVMMALIAVCILGVSCGAVYLLKKKSHR